MRTIAHVSNTYTNLDPGISIFLFEGLVLVLFGSHQTHQGHVQHQGNGTHYDTDTHHGVDKDEDG